MSSGFLPSFLGALQASLSVLLTISYGVIASRFNLLRENSARDISKICVRIFLPALLITNVGSEIQADTVMRYVPVLVWALAYTLFSMGLGYLLRRIFKWPSWVVPAICFNNTTALPLLLLQSLETSGVLKDLTKVADDTPSAAVGRAKSYFLVASIVGNCLTFAIGPKLLDDEESPDKEEEEDTRDPLRANGHESDEEHAKPTNESGRTADEQEEHVNESTSLLPERIANRSGDLLDGMQDVGEKHWVKLPESVQHVLRFGGSCLNAPLVGAIVGAIIGLVPPFHKAFFNEPDNGGVFNAWLTSSVENVGELFAALQLVVVGAKLSGSLLKMKKGEDAGEVRVIPVLTICFIRFILWPVASIGIIYIVASKTSWLEPDPILWFTLMLLPTGPPATKLVSLGDVSGATEGEKMSIAKFVTLSYMISPIICFAVVGSLKASVALKS